jgi:glutamyl-tRNA synthetase
VPPDRTRSWATTASDRDLSDEQVAAFKAEGREAVLRLRMPDEDITFNDLVRGEITFKAGSVPDFAVVRANGAPLYTLVNPVDDALMGITHVLRGEDLLSSTPRQIALYRALYAVGVAEYMPEFGHLPYVMGQGNKKLSKRDPESTPVPAPGAWLHPRGPAQLPFPARLVPERRRGHLHRGAAGEEFRHPRRPGQPGPLRHQEGRSDQRHACAAAGPCGLPRASGPVPPARRAGGGILTDRQEEILTESAPLVQERITLLGEAPEMLAFLFKADDAIDVAADARKGLPENVTEVLDAALAALEPIDDWNAENIQSALKQALVEDLGIKPRLAFGPVRTAISGRRISPPLFESMVILGKDSSLARLRAFRG